MIPIARPEMGEELTEQVVSIPVHPSLTDTEVATVIAAVNEVAALLGPITVPAPV